MIMRPRTILELRCADGPGGGPEKTILHGAALADPRFHVVVCYIREAGDACTSIADRAHSLGIDYVEIRQRGAFDPRVWIQLRRLVRQRGVALVHSHDYKTDFLALGLARFEGVVPLSTAHGWSGHSWKERLIYYPIDRRLLARFPLVFAVSNELREELVCAGVSPTRVRTLLNGVDAQRFRRDPARREASRARWGLAPGDVVLGAMGRLHEGKRFDLLIETVTRLRTRRPAVCLIIAGEGDERPRLEAALRQRGLDDRACLLAGHCADPTALYEACDVFVQSSDHEGTPNVVLEAMAMETPIVATDVGGTGELARAEIDAILVPPRRVETWIEAIERTLDEREATAQRVRNARQRVETTLSFERRVRTLEAAYDALLTRGGRLRSNRRRNVEAA
jgi:glycosyltransferase involved in cell wall biosynthesis